MKKYNHAFTVAFSLNSDHENTEDDLVTEAELLKALKRRLYAFEYEGESIVECCGGSFDTYENER